LLFCLRLLPLLLQFRAELLGLAFHPVADVDRTGDHEQ
jgi:hypothetical protein